MKKKSPLRMVTDAERKRLGRELKQMWSTVPPQALIRARKLSGVEAGKEDAFRLAVVRDEESSFFIDYSVPVKVRGELFDGVVKGEDAKLLTLQLQCGDRIWQIEDGVYAKRFERSEQLDKWLAGIDHHILSNLLERLRDTCVYVWDEAVAKASNTQGVRRIGLTALADAHVKEIRRDLSRVLSIKRGTEKGSKQSKLQLTKRQFEVDLPQYIRQMGEDVKRKHAATRFHFPNLKAFDRAFKVASARWGQKRGWREYKVWVMTKTK